MKLTSKLTAIAIAGEEYRFNIETTSLTDKGKHVEVLNNVIFVPKENGWVFVGPDKPEHNIQNSFGKSRFNSIKGLISTFIGCLVEQSNFKDCLYEEDNAARDAFKGIYLMNNGVVVWLPKETTPEDLTKVLYEYLEERIGGFTL